MDEENNIEFIFNTSCEFISFKISGNISLYTDPNNFIGRNIKDVLPENVATLTTAMINKCIGTTENQEYDYTLAGEKFHSILTLTKQGIKAYITSK